MERSPFHLVISDLRVLGDERRAVVEAPVEWALETSRIVPEPPLHAELAVRTVAGGLLITGPCSFAVHHTCQRCLTEWDEDVDVEVTQLFAAEGDEDLADADYHYSGDAVDVEPMLRDEALLAIPLVPTCGGDCPGLEPPAETGLNTEAPEDAAPSPFAVLKDLFEGSE
jgi:uncharacterized protein